MCDLLICVCVWNLFHIYRTGIWNLGFGHFYVTIYMCLYLKYSKRFWIRVENMVLLSVFVSEFSFAAITLELGIHVMVHFNVTFWHMLYSEHNWNPNWGCGPFLCDPFNLCLWANLVLQQSHLNFEFMLWSISMLHMLYSEQIWTPNWGCGPLWPFNWYLWANFVLQGSHLNLEFMSW